MGEWVGEWVGEGRTERASGGARSRSPIMHSALLLRGIASPLSRSLEETISSVLFPKRIPLVGSLRGIGARLGAAAALRAGDRGGCAAAERMSGDRILEDGGGRRRLGEARALGPSLCSLFALVAGVALGMCGEVPRWARAAVGIAALVVRSQN